MQVLQSGNNTAIQDRKLVVRIAGEASLLNLALSAAFLVGRDGRALDSSLYVMAGSPTPPEYIRTEDGTAYTLDLDGAPPTVEKIVIILAIPGGSQSPITFGAFDTLTTMVNDAAGTPLAACPLPLAGRAETALVLAEVYRYQGGWKVRAVGQGYNWGIEALARQYGLDIRERRGNAAESDGAPRDERRPSGGARSGTGFFVSRDGFLITNHHVVEGMSEFAAASPRGRAGLELVFSDRHNDLALLKSATPPASVAAFRTGRTALLGEGVISIGYPLSGLLGSGPQVTTGNVSSLIGLGDDTRSLQFTAPVQSGNSGGPLFDSTGAVVGVINSKLDAAKIQELTGDLPQNVNFAIKAAIATSFLDALGVDWVVEMDSTSRGTAEIAHRAQAYVFRVECRP
jgi:hypothetical protein